MWTLRKAVRAAVALALTILPWVALLSIPVLQPG
jgi:hypothetical protein